MCLLLLVATALLLATPAWAGLPVAYDADYTTLKKSLDIGDPLSFELFETANCTGNSGADGTNGTDRADGATRAGAALAVFDADGSEVGHLVDFLDGGGSSNTYWVYLDAIAASVRLSDRGELEPVFLSLVPLLANAAGVPGQLNLRVCATVVPVSSQIHARWARGRPGCTLLLMADTPARESPDWGLRIRRAPRGAILERPIKF